MGNKTTKSNSYWFPLSLRLRIESKRDRKAYLSQTPRKGYEFSRPGDWDGSTESPPPRRPPSQKSGLRSPPPIKGGSRKLPQHNPHDRTHRTRGSLNAEKTPLSADLSPSFLTRVGSFFWKIVCVAFRTLGFANCGFCCVCVCVCGRFGFVGGVEILRTEAVFVCVCL